MVRATVPNVINDSAGVISGRIPIVTLRHEVIIAPTPWIGGVPPSIHVNFDVEGLARRPAFLSPPLCPVRPAHARRPLIVWWEAVIYFVDLIVVDLGIHYCLRPAGDGDPEDFAAKVVVSYYLPAEPKTC